MTPRLSEKQLPLMDTVQPVSSVVYIAGYGRSGSTILDIILGNHDEVVSLGEVSNLQQLIAQPGPLGCSCGEQVMACPYWSQVIGQLPAQSPAEWHTLAQLLRRVESIGALPNLMRGAFAAGGRQSELGCAYREQVLALLGAVRRTSGARVALDSSKTTWLTIGRPFALAKLCGLNVKVVHLIRDGRAVMWSGMKGTNKELSRGVRKRSLLLGFKTALSWALVNLLTSLILRAFPRQNVMRLHYEDLVENPTSTIDALQNFLGLDLASIHSRIVQGGEFAVPHLLAGNRVAQKSVIRLRADHEWRKMLPVSSRWLYWIILWPIALFYKRPISPLPQPQNYEAL